MRATAQLSGRSVVAGRSRFKRCPEICSNFRTFLLSLHKIYGRKSFGFFSAEIFRKITVIFRKISGIISPEIFQLTTLSITDQRMAIHCAVIKFIGNLPMTIRNTE